MSAKTYMFILTPRQQNILDAIVEKYINGALPISSDFLRREGGFDFSGATIRAEMAELEARGFLVQSHTSAGRTPTENAYRLFVEQHSNKWGLSEKIREKFGQISRLWSKNKLAALETAADDIAGFSQVTSMVTLTWNDQAVFLQRFRDFRLQPEFSSPDIVGEMLSAIEILEKRRNEILNSADANRTSVFIGKDIKFGKFNFLSLVIRPWRNRNSRASGFIATVGPLRMHYERAIPTIDYLGSVLADFTEE